MPWNTPKIIGLFVGSGTLFICFGACNKRSENTLLFQLRFCVNDLFFEQLISHAFLNDELCG